MDAIEPQKQKSLEAGKESQNQKNFDSNKITLKVEAFWNQFYF